MTFDRRYRNTTVAACFAAVLVAGNANGSDATSDLSICLNCEEFPSEFLEVDEKDLLELNSVAPERLLDFLIGEWEIYYPGAERAGYEIFQWFRNDKVIEAFQEWSFAASGEIPWRGKSFYQYVQGEERWHFNWAPADGPGALWTGGLEADGREIVFYEYDFSGDARQLRLKPDLRYVMKNITQDHFLVEMYRTDDGGKTYALLRDRLYYKRRTN